ncbi:MAG: O-antigen ligase family protein [Neptuniibacter sp.]
MVNLNIASQEKLKTLFSLLFVNLAYATIYFSPGIEHGGQVPLFFLFLLSVPLIFSKKCYQDIDIKFLFALVFVFIAAIPLAIKSGEGEALDAPSRFLIVSIVFIALYRMPINGTWILRSAIAACLLASTVSIHEITTTNTNRVNLGIGILESAYTLSILIFMCVAALFNEKNLFWKALAVSAIVAGSITLLQTGTRGAWLACVVGGVLFLELKTGKLLCKKFAFGVLIFSVASFITYNFSDSVNIRVSNTVKEFQKLGDFNRKTSSNLRLIYWEHAWEGFKLNPITGLSYQENASLRKEFAKRYNVHMTGTQDGRSSSHNEILNAMVQKGVIGLLAILLVYLIPLKHFLNKLKSTQTSVKNYALAGISTISVMFISGLTEAPLMHTSVSVTYGMMLVLLYHAIRNEELKHKETSCSP